MMGHVKTNTAGHAIRVWDLPTRLFHWLLVAAFLTAWFTHEYDRYLYIHVFAGYVAMGLLLFRLLWGLFGGPYARFCAFAFGWRSVRMHLTQLFSGKANGHLGHNPAGAWFIYLLLALTATVVITGLVALGGEERHGLLAGLFSFSTGARFHAIHAFLALAMVGLIAMHLAGVVAESLATKENLVRAMISGHKRRPGTLPQTAMSPRYGWVALGLAAATITYALWHFAGYAWQTPERPYLPFQGPELADNATWRGECGSCHLAYHPSLLPARAWTKMLDQQDRHFGDDLALDGETVQALRAFAGANAAETAPTEAAWKINVSLSQTGTPLRISTTPYWKQKHADIAEAVWRRNSVRSRANCGACHLDASRGTFEDSAMRIPAPLAPTLVAAGTTPR